MINKRDFYLKLEQQRTVVICRRNGLLEAGGGNTAVLNHLQTQLQRIVNALIRLNEERFGICEQCGTDIHANRLRLLPYAELCITCQRRREKISR